VSGSPAAVVRGRERVFVQIGDGCYQLTVASLGLKFTIDRLRRESHALHGELTVECNLAGARTNDGYLPAGDLNVSSVDARHKRAKVFADGKMSGP
jgi:hypothetical protein